jgi:PAS domain S-box-containing protein
MTQEVTVQRSLRILHVEDNDADAELIRALLLAEWPDCSITRVETRPEFEAAVKQDGFDIFLSDFSLPRFDGLTALEIARQHDTATPFIFISGTIGEERAVEAMQRGAMDYVLKDRPARLVPSIRRALELVSEQKKRRAAEQRLDESRKMLSELAERSSELFWSVSRNRILFVSPAFERIWGLPIAELERDPLIWLDSVHQDDRERVKAAFDEVLRGAQISLEEEYRLVRPDGSQRWVLDSRLAFADPQGARVSGTVRDITELKQVEQKLRGQAELLDKARDMIVVCGVDRRIFYWNAGAERVLGWKSDEAIGRTCEELTGDDVFRIVVEGLADSGNAEWIGEVQVHGREGKLHTLDMRVNVISTEGNQSVASHLIICTDVTEQRLLEKQYLRAQRLESVGTLAGGIAHDLNNVLTPIVMAVNLLQRREPDADTQKFLAIMEKSAAHGTNLVKQVLAFARGDEGPREMLDPGKIINDVVELLGQTLPRSITVETRLAPQLMQISADETQLGQVLMNLCVNARDAMPDGGRLTVSADNVTVEAAQARANPGAVAGPHVMIAVQDTGTGMPPKVLEKIFDPFFTTKGAGKGTGLGLATVMGILKSHGGFLQVASEVGRGTVFSLFFPIGQAGLAERGGSAREQTAKAQGETVLVIDDEMGIRETCRAILEDHGYNVLAAENGAEGIELFRQHQSLIRAVVTDLMMPGVQGAEVLRTVRQAQADLPFVVMSGVTGELRGLDAEAKRLVFLPKPMSGDALLQALASLLSDGPDPGVRAP